MNENTNNWVKISNYYEDTAWINLSRVARLTVGRGGGTNYYYIYADGEQLPVKFTSKFIAEDELKKIFAR